MPGGFLVAHKLQGEQFMRLRAQNAHYVSCPSDKTVGQNLLLNISIESLEPLRHSECLKILLKLFEVILLVKLKRAIFEVSNTTTSTTTSTTTTTKNRSF